MAEYQFDAVVALLTMKPAINVFFFGTGEFSSRVDRENTGTTAFPNSKEAIYGTYSSSKGNIAPLPPSSSMVSARKSKPVWTCPAQQLESELQILSQTQVFRQ